MDKSEIKKEIIKLQERKREIENLSIERRKACEISYNLIRHEIVKLRYLLNPPKSDFDKIDEYLNNSKETVNNYKIKIL